MPKYTVDLVKYDTEKTTKRKRSDLIVDAKTEKAVIQKLEKIHKGDKVKLIHEISWGDEVAEKRTRRPRGVYKGVVKFFNEEKGFGFIEPDGDLDDLFFHKSALGGVTVHENDLVEFEESESPKGVTAVCIKLVEKDHQ